VPHHHEPPTDPFDPEEQPIIPGRIVVRRDQVGEARRVIPALREIDIGEVLMASFGTEELGARERGAFEAIWEDIAYLALDSNDAETTLQAVDDLQDEGIDDARPMFYCWVLNHWSAQPGVKPADASTIDMTRWNRVRDASWPVWVVDSGYDDKNPWTTPPDGPLSNLVEFDDGGGDPAIRAHGTFVTGLVRAMSPNSPIMVLRTDFSHEDGTKSDELAVGVKLRRAIDEYADSYAGQHAVINLSLGTYAAFTQTAKAMVPLTLEDQISKAAQYKDTLTLVAAAGNEWSHANNGDVAYPASDPRVKAVGAGDSDAGDKPLDWVLWIGENREKWIFKPLPSGLALSPGNNIVAPTGKGFMTSPSDTGFASWSGSSFAAALYSGRLAATGDKQPDQTKDAYRQLLGTPGDTIIP
jgi:hypothetical protein